MLLLLADIALTLFHALVVAFITVGWAFRRMRRLHLATVIAMFASWFVLGAWYGWGYCFLTDWAWRLKRKRGVTDLPDSFIQWLLDGMTGVEWNPAVVDGISLFVALAAFVLSVALKLKSDRARDRDEADSRGRTVVEKELNRK